MDTGRIWEIAEHMQGEIAREIRTLLAQEQYDQRIFNDEERARRIEALKLSAAERMSSAERHLAWVQMHLDQGWVYGPEFRPDLKQHPNLVPWEDVPADAKAKAEIFAIVARHVAQIVELCAPSTSEL